MTVGQAKNIARLWVEQHKGEIERFAGVFFTGSINFKLEDVLWEKESSDVDIHILIDGKVLASIWQQKLLYQGVILDPSCKNRNSFKTPENVLSSVMYTCHFTVPSAVAGPSGHLAKHQVAVVQNSE